MHRTLRAFSVVLALASITSASSSQVLILPGFGEDRSEVAQRLVASLTSEAIFDTIRALVPQAELKHLEALRIEPHSTTTISIRDGRTVRETLVWVRCHMEGLADSIAAMVVVACEDLARGQLTALEQSEDAF